MKLGKKIFLSLGVAWLLFSACIVLLYYVLNFESFSLIKPISSNLSLFLSSYLCLSLILIGVIYILHYFSFIKPLIQLEHQIFNIQKGNHLDQRVVTNGNDEIALMAAHMNSILARTEALQKYFKENEMNKMEIDRSPSKKSTDHFNFEQDEIVRLSPYDTLTSLPNRVFFNEILNKTISHAKRHNKLLAILFIDFDQFKKVNDQYGKAIGDMILREMGNRLIKILRAGDIIARLGGDEFMILLNDINNAKFAGPVAEKILHACTRPIKINHHHLSVTASIGISIFPFDGESLEDLQRHADTALFKAKHEGGGVYQYFMEEMDVTAHEHMRFETELKNAIERRQFVLYYQPQLNLENGAIQSVEALIRWEHPTLGLLVPDKFIPLAEETGLITQIGLWALKTACETTMLWKKEGYDPIKVAVNISPFQIRQHNLVRLISETLREYHLDPKLLEIEITENTLMGDQIELIKNNLAEIHDMGVSISIDDFGMGYTSINYLKQFPINILKIDKSFVKGSLKNPNDLAIITAIIELGHNLGLKVVAEGVETATQLQYLAEQHCDLIQGYFLSRPLPENKIILQFSKKGHVLEA